MKQLFMGNRSLKVASVVIAVGLWFFINARGISEITVPVPLGIRNLPANHEIVSGKPAEVSIGLRGHEQLIRSVSPQSLGVSLNLVKPKEGWGTYTISKDEIKTPAGIEVTKIEPASFRLRVERTITREVPVKAVITGSPKPGYGVAGVLVTPRAVTVEGARGLVEKIAGFRTEEVDISGRSATFEQDVTVITDGENVRVGGDTVKVRIMITKGVK